MYSEQQKKFMKILLEKGRDVDGFTMISTDVYEGTKIKIIFNRNDLFYMSYVDPDGKEEIIVEGNQTNVCELYNSVGIYMKTNLLDTGGA